MTTSAENERLTHIGPGTPAGNLLRRYWQPAALADELPRWAPDPVRMLGEDLVLFRDEAGEARPAGAPLCPSGSRSFLRQAGGWRAPLHLPRLAL